MGKRGFWAALAASVILFVWNSYNWAYIPWDCLTIHQFENEAEMALMIKQNAKEDGIYILPTVPCHLKNLGGPWGKIYRDQTERAKLMGPIMFSVISLEGSAEEKYTPFITSFLINAVVGFIVTFLVIRFKTTHFWKRVGLVTLMGFLVGFGVYMPLWNWEGFSFSFAAFNILYPLGGWFLAALALAYILKRKKPPQANVSS